MSGGLRRARRAGAAPAPEARTAWLSETRPREQLFVGLLRHWLEGPEAQAGVWNGLAGSLGPGRARALLEAFEGFLRTAAPALRRRLTRHQPHCPCLGEDEAALAALVLGAGGGDRAGAHAAARALVAAEEVPAVLRAAERLGAELGRAGSPEGRTLH
jgi:hypothetical protein